MTLITDRLFAELEDMKKIVEDIITRKLEKKDLAEFKAKITAQLDGKVDLVEVQSALNTCQSDISVRFMEYKEEVKNLIRNHESEIFNLLSKKANLSDVNAALANKVDSSVVNQLISQKPGYNEIEDMRRRIEQMLKEDDKVTIRGNILFSFVISLEFESNIGHLRKLVDDLQKELLLKANIKDVCTLLDTKSSTLIRFFS